MLDKIKVKVKDFIDKIDRAAGIQLTMILFIVVAYGIFLSVQKFLFSFEGFQTKIITVNVLLAVGILIEIVYFIWHTNKQGKEKKPDAEKKNDNE
jgi:hypothetical protein